MNRQVKIISQRQVFKKAIFRIVEAHLQYERHDGGMSPEIVRLNLDRGDSVAALVHDVTQDNIVVTEQFRYPTLEKGTGWIVEIPAGMVDANESPAAAMQRELLEEVGYRAGELELIASCFLSPGGSSERIHLFYVPVDGADRQTDGGGMIAEDEDIRVVSYPLDAMLKDLRSGLIHDAKTLIAAQWLALNRERLTPL